MEAAFLSHRAKLLAFFAARGASAAEDLLHELWLSLPSEDAHIESPLSYMYRTANSLVIKQFRRETEGMHRDTAWQEASGPSIPGRSDHPGADRVVEAREAIALVLAALQGEGERVFRIFCRHRVDGLTQVQVAAEMGVSIGTVENDLRRARRVLSALRENAGESILSV